MVVQSNGTAALNPLNVLFCFVITEKAQIKSALFIWILAIVLLLHYKYTYISQIEQSEIIQLLFWWSKTSQFKDNTTKREEILVQ